MKDFQFVRIFVLCIPHIGLRVHENSKDVVSHFVRAAQFTMHKRQVIGCCVMQKKYLLNFNTVYERHPNNSKYFMVWRYICAIVISFVVLTSTLRLHSMCHVCAKHTCPHIIISLCYVLMGSWKVPT